MNDLGPIQTPRPHLVRNVDFHKKYNIIIIICTILKKALYGSEWSVQVYYQNTSNAFERQKTHIHSNECPLTFLLVHT